jgi:glutamyl-tRNA synthetase
MSKIRTRFAPSPTGNLHIGGLRTAAYAFALAKHNDGKFLLRIEDTDQKRSTPESKDEIYKYLKMFGLDWDEEYVQSERVKEGVYEKAAKKLLEQGNAYEDDGAIRLKVPKGEEISYHDYVLDKDVTWKTDILQDMVILKSDGFPTYHLAVVVDDHDMGVTHVLRGHDWIPSTPIHLLIHKFLGFDLPRIGHLTDIQDPSGGKLSKRKGSVSLNEFVSDGYLPEALLNFVILLGWAPKDNRELFTLEEFVEAFDPAGFQKSNPVFNTKKLDWFNGHYIRSKSDEDLLKLIKPFSKYNLTVEIVGLIKERITKLSDVDDLVKFFFEKPDVQKDLHAEYLEAAIKTIEDGGDLAEMAKEKGWKLGDFFMDLRLAIAGQKITPPLNESMVILGKDEVIARLRANISH